MPITLVTGIPGAGKTLYVVKHLVEDILPSDRLIFHNIAGLNIDHPNIFSVDDEGMRLWPTMPKKAVIIIDECQNVFPPRNPMSSVPPFVNSFAVHRHSGFDIYLITQGPSLIDAFIHPLVAVHKHLWRPFQLSRSSLFTYQGVSKTPGPRQTIITANRTNFSFPRKYFSFYKSADAHTIKPEIPWRFIVLGFFLLFALVGAGWWVLKDFWKLADTGQDQLAALETPQERTCYRVVGVSAAGYFVRDPAGAPGLLTHAVAQSMIRHTRENGLNLCHTA